MSDGYDSDAIPSRRLAKLGQIDASDMGQGRPSQRQDDSSSSRESSPHKERRRSFTPPSDDGELVAPPTQDADTPPPEGPLLRQAVAFSSPATQVNTYQASLAPSLPPSRAVFLPGQEVPVSVTAPSSLSQSKGPRNAKAKAKTRRFNDAFSDKTGSFRLKGYVNDSSANVQPPIHFGTGPYTSMYRAKAPELEVTSGNATPGGNEASSTTTFSVSNFTPISSTSSGVQSSSLPRANSFLSGHNTISDANATFRPIAFDGHARTTQVPHSSAKGRSSKPKAASRKSAPSVQRGSDMRHPPQQSGPVPNQHTNQLHTATTTTINNASSSSGSSHYHYDYVTGTDLTHSAPSFDPGASSSSAAHYIIQPGLHHDPPSPSPSETVQTVSSNATVSRIPNPNSPSGSSSNLRNRIGNTQSEVVGVARPLRMVTILIEDIRSGIADHQLAEVNVPLRPADTPEGGFWADAKHISEALQSSPSRIDGPAKVYTLRGKYRQFFLRVSADNVDDISSANVIVTNQRTLDVVVEANPPPDGSLPLPPKIPYKLIRTPTPESDPPPSSKATSKTAVQDARSHKSSEREGSNRGFSRKRRRSSPSSDESSNRGGRSDSPQHSQSRTPPSSPNANSYNTSTSSYRLASNAPPKRRKSYGKSSSQEPIKISSVHSRDIVPHEDHDYPRPGSPKLDSSPEEINTAIWKAIQTSIADDEAWADFMRSKGAAHPHKISEVLKQYEFVQRKVDEWDGRRAPFKSSHHKVNKSHVLYALYVDEQWGSECTETLELLELYGPDGERYKDARVIDMIEDSSPPAGRPAKRLLRLLREIDDEWAATREQPPVGGPPPRSHEWSGDQRDVPA